MVLGTPNGAEDPWRDPKWELGTPGRTQNGSWGPLEGPKMGVGDQWKDPKWGRGPPE